MAESPTLTSSADIIEVANIDLACELEDPEVHPNGTGSFVVYYGRRVDSSGRPANAAPFIVEAGKTRMFPRYIAEHFAKHLANHILTAKEIDINHKVERPKLLTEIIRGTRESFGGPAQPEVVEIDTTPLKEVPPTPLKEPEVKVEVKPVPTRRQLFNELKVLGVKTTGKEPVATLVDMIQKGAYGEQ